MAPTTTPTGCLTWPPPASRVCLIAPQLHCDLFLICAGIKPHVELARQAGLAVNRAVIVDQQMRTSVPELFAAGDVAEYDGQVHGLWPIAVEQAEVAAVNAAGGTRLYQGSVPMTMLKVVGVDLTSIGRFQPESESNIVIVQEEPELQRYGKLVIAEGRIVGAILLGCPRNAPAISTAIRQAVDVRPHLEALRAGHWEVLTDA